jgi:hypothetical protein
MEYSKFIGDITITSSMFPASVLSYTADNEELYLDGTMTISIRRGNYLDVRSFINLYLDPVNLPILMAASFLPRLV